VPQNWSRKLRNAPTATSSNKIFQGASTSLARIMTVAQRHASIPNTPEIRFAIRVFIAPSPSSQSSRPTSLGEDQEPRNKAEDRREQDHAETCSQANRHHGEFEYGTGFATPVPIRRGYGRFGGFLESAVRVAAHPLEHGPERAVLLAVDQEFGEGASSRSGRGGVP
jgi:hypothetical protein